jgi:DNA-binding MarR family transcriptional regulator
VQHGVHIPIEGIIAFVLHAFPEVDVPLERKLQFALHAIVRHELFHFNVDCMTANWELATGAAVYWKGLDRYRKPYGYVELEEGLANAYMLRGFKYPTRLLANSGGAYQALKRFCARQPAGYKDAARYVKTRGHYLDSFFGASFELSEMYQHESREEWRSPETLDALIFYPDLKRIDWTRCPIVILDDHDLRGALGLEISNFQMVEFIEETDGFRRSLSKLDRRLQQLWTARKSTQYLVLATLWEWGDLSVGALMKHLNLDYGTVTPLLKRMEKRELVERTRNPLDERTVIVTLAPKGQALQAEAPRINKAIIDTFDFNPERAAAANAILVPIADRASRVAGTAAIASDELG